MQAWLERSDDAEPLPPRPAARGAHPRRRADVPHALGLDDRGRGRAEHDHPQRLRAQHGLRHAARAPASPQRAILEANMGGDKKPSHEYFHSGHGKTVLAEAFLPDERIGRVLHTTRRRPRGALLGRHARRGRLGHAVGRLHARERRSPPSSPRPGRTSAWSAPPRWRTAPRAGSRAACRPRSASRGSRSARSAAARRCPRRATGSTAIGCAGAGARLPLRADRRRGGALPRDQRLGVDGDRRQRELLHAPTTQRGGLR